MKINKNGIMTAVSGVLIGAVNGLFGAGGGMLAVPLLTKLGLERKQAHANAVAVILPITVLSAFFYVFRGYVTVKESLVFIPGGVTGALIGTYCLKKISSVWLKRIFGAFMVYAGVRLLLK
ncbi:MAG: sulfite exporter TauE/SafE family protein [Acutalibacteraceae bacterium]|nr:sulfite exporter TauE/SafE family protein [Acutalibacteraceae bacterium]